MLANFEQHCWPVLQVASICYTFQHFGQHFQSLESLYNRHLNHVIKANKEESLLVFDDIVSPR